jgi:hypothetical protein
MATPTPAPTSRHPSAARLTLGLRWSDRARHHQAWRRWRGACVATLLGLVLTSVAWAQGRVVVGFADPSSYTDVTNRLGEAADSALLAALARQIEQRAAPCLGQGQTLQVTIRDIDQAGEIDLASAFSHLRRGAEPLRVVRDGRSPHISLSYRLLAADAPAADLSVPERQEELGDMGFLQRPLPAGLGLYSLGHEHERALVDRWARARFCTATGG